MINKLASVRKKLAKKIGKALNFDIQKEDIDFHKKKESNLSEIKLPKKIKNPEAKNSKFFDELRS